MQLTSSLCLLVLLLCKTQFVQSRPGENVNLAEGKSTKIDHYNETKITLDEAFKRTDDNIKRLVNFASKSIPTKQISVLKPILDKTTHFYRSYWDQVGQLAKNELRVFGTTFVTSYKGMFSSYQLISATETTDRLLKIWGTGIDDLATDDPLLLKNKKYFDGGDASEMNEALKRYDADWKKELGANDPGPSRSALQSLLNNTNMYVNAELQNMANTAQQTLTSLKHCILVGKELKRLAKYSRTTDNGKFEHQFENLKQCVQLSKILQVPGIFDTLQTVDRRKLFDIDFDDSEFDMPEDELDEPIDAEKVPSLPDTKLNKNKKNPNRGKKFNTVGDGNDLLNKDKGSPGSHNGSKVNEPFPSINPQEKDEEDESYEEMDEIEDDDDDADMSNHDKYIEDANKGRQGPKKGHRSRKKFNDRPKITERENPLQGSSPSISTVYENPNVKSLPITTYGATPEDIGWPRGSENGDKKNKETYFDGNEEHNGTGKSLERESQPLDQIKDNIDKEMKNGNESNIDENSNRGMSLPRNRRRMPRKRRRNNSKETDGSLPQEDFKNHPHNVTLGSAEEDENDYDGSDEVKAEPVNGTKRTHTSINPKKFPKHGHELQRAQLPNQNNPNNEGEEEYEDDYEEEDPNEDLTAPVNGPRRTQKRKKPKSFTKQGDELQRAQLSNKENPNDGPLKSEEEDEGDYEDLNEDFSAPINGTEKVSPRKNPNIIPKQGDESQFNDGPIISRTANPLQGSSPSIATVYENPNVKSLPVTTYGAAPKNMGWSRGADNGDQKNRETDFNGNEEDDGTGKILERESRPLGQIKESPDQKMNDGHEGNIDENSNQDMSLPRNRRRMARNRRRNNGPKPDGSLLQQHSENYPYDITMDSANADDYDVSNEVIAEPVNGTKRENSERNPDRFPNQGDELQEAQLPKKDNPNDEGLESVEEYEDDYEEEGPNKDLLAPVNGPRRIRRKRKPKSFTKEGDDLQRAQLPMKDNLNDGPLRGEENDGDDYEEEDPYEDSIGDLSTPSNGPRKGRRRIGPNVIPEQGDETQKAKPPKLDFINKGNKESPLLKNTMPHNQHTQNLIPDQAEKGDTSNYLNNVDSINNYDDLVPKKELKETREPLFPEQGNKGNGEDDEDEFEYYDEVIEEKVKKRRPKTKKTMEQPFGIKEDRPRQSEFQPEISTVEKEADDKNPRSLLPSKNDAPVSGNQRGILPEESTTFMRPDGSDNISLKPSEDISTADGKTDPDSKLPELGDVTNVNNPRKKGSLMLEDEDEYEDENDDVNEEHRNDISKPKRKKKRSQNDVPKLNPLSNNTSGNIIERPETNAFGRRNENGSPLTENKNSNIIDSQLEGTPEKTCVNGSKKKGEVFVEEDDADNDEEHKNNKIKPMQSKNKKQKILNGISEIEPPSDVVGRPRTTSPKATTEHESENNPELTEGSKIQVQEEGDPDEYEDYYDTVKKIVRKKRPKQKNKQSNNNTPLSEHENDQGSHDYGEKPQINNAESADLPGKVKYNKKPELGGHLDKLEDYLAELNDPEDQDESDKGIILDTMKEIPSSMRNSGNQDLQKEAPIKPRNIDDVVPPEESSKTVITFSGKEKPWTDVNNSPTQNMTKEPFCHGYTWEALLDRAHESPLKYSIDITSTKLSNAREEVKDIIEDIKSKIIAAKRPTEKQLKRATDQVIDEVLHQFQSLYETFRIHLRTDAGFFFNLLKDGVVRARHISSPIQSKLEEKYQNKNVPDTPFWNKVRTLFKGAFNFKDYLEAIVYPRPLLRPPQTPVEVKNISLIHLERLLDESEIILDDIECTMLDLYHALTKGVKVIQKIRKQLKANEDSSLDENDEKDLEKALEVFNLLYNRKKNDRRKHDKSINFFDSIDEKNELEDNSAQKMVPNNEHDIADEHLAKSPSLISNTDKNDYLKGKKATSPQIPKDFDTHQGSIRKNKNKPKDYDIEDDDDSAYLSRIDDEKSPSGRRDPTLEDLNDENLNLKQNGAEWSPENSITSNPTQRINNHPDLIKNNNNGPIKGKAAAEEPEISKDSLPIAQENKFGRGNVSITKPKRGRRYHHSKRYSPDQEPDTHERSQPRSIRKELNGPTQGYSTNEKPESFEDKENISPPINFQRWESIQPRDFSTEFRPGRSDNTNLRSPPSYMKTMRGGNTNGGSPELSAVSTNNPHKINDVMGNIAGEIDQSPLNSLWGDTRPQQNLNPQNNNLKSQGQTPKNLSRTDVRRARSWHNPEARKHVDKHGILRPPYAPSNPTPAPTTNNFIENHIRNLFKNKNKPDNFNGITKPKTGTLEVNSDRPEAVKNTNPFAPITNLNKENFPLNLMPAPTSKTSIPYNDGILLKNQPDKINDIMNPETEPLILKSYDSEALNSINQVPPITKLDEERRMLDSNDEDISALLKKFPGTISDDLKNSKDNDENVKGDSGVSKENNYLSGIDDVKTPSGRRDPFFGDDENEEPDTNSGTSLEESNIPGQQNKFKNDNFGQQPEIKSRNMNKQKPNNSHNTPVFNLNTKPTNERKNNDGSNEDSLYTHNPNEKKTPVGKVPEFSKVIIKTAPQNKNHENNGANVDSSMGVENPNEKGEIVKHDDDADSSGWSKINKKRTPSDSRDPTLENLYDEDPNLKQNGAESLINSNPSRKKRKRTLKGKKTTKGHLVIVNEDGSMTYTQVDPNMVSDLIPDHGSYVYESTNDKRHTKMIQITDQEKLAELSKKAKMWNPNSGDKIPDHVLNELMKVNKSGAIVDAINNKVTLPIDRNKHADNLILTMTNNA